MQEKTYKFWDIIIKAFGFLATAASIYFGLNNFNRQQAATLDLEFKRNFWKKQTEIYIEVCQNTGALVACTNDAKEYENEKKKFLTLYYGEMVLVEDNIIDSLMREIKSYIEILEPKDENMVNVLKRKAVALSIACKRSLELYKKETEQ